MKDKITKNVHKLSNKSIMVRKRAIKELSVLMHHEEAFLARLCLHYISVHDPSYTLRNLAKQAFYRIGGAPPQDQHCWEKTHHF